MTEATLSQLVWDGDRAPLAKAFVAAQRASEAVKKASTNPAFRSKYADLAGVVEAVMPALNDNGVGVIQSPGFDGDWVSVETVLLHESGASVASILRLRPSKSDPQGVGSAITYARRYALLAMTGAAPEDDDGNAASGPRQEPAQHREQPKAPTLAERATRFERTLLDVKSAGDLDKAYKLGAALCAELDLKDPERLAAIDLLVEKRRDELTTKAPVLEAAE